MSWFGSGKDEKKVAVVPAVNRAKTFVLRKGKGSRGKMTAKGGYEKSFSTAAMAIPWKMFSADNKPYRVRQMIDVGSFTTSTTGAVFPAYSFTVSQLDQVTTLASLFDQYRITHIELCVLPRTEMVNNASSNMGLLASCIDYDDDIALTSVASCLDYQNVIQAPGQQAHYRSWKPHALQPVYNSGSIAQYGANVQSPWIDAASQSVKHYGLKLAQTITDSGYVYDVVAVMYTEWKNLR